MSSVQQKLQDNQTEQCNPCIGKKSGMRNCLCMGPDVGHSRQKLHSRYYESVKRPKENDV